MRPFCVMPDEDSAEMSSLVHLPLENGNAAYVVCAYRRLSVVAPAEMTSGSVAGLPMVLVMPASPDDVVTVTPAATALSLKTWNRLRIE